MPKCPTCHGVGERWVTAGVICDELGIANQTLVRGLAERTGPLGSTSWRRLGEVVLGIQGQRGRWRVWPESALRAEIERRGRALGLLP